MSSFSKTMGKRSVPCTGLSSPVGATAVPPELALSDALFLDVDGTLLEIADRPEAVVVRDELRTVLSKLHAVLNGAIALVSGRTLADIGRLFAPLSLMAAGAHGAEIGRIPLLSASPPPTAALPDAVRRVAHALAARSPGLLVEDKGHSLAVHYRLAPEWSQEVTARLVDVATEAGLVALPGHCVIEVKRPGYDKGTALARLMRNVPFAGRRPVFIGDDVTDEPAAVMASALGGVAASVGRDMQGAIRAFETPAQVTAWLARQADRLEAPR
jgi:trehalose 6-phosphate phosphatase